MNRYSFLIICCGMSFSAQAQSFEKYFEDNTLRIDYSFSGDHEKQAIFIDELNKTPIWAGRRHHLKELPLAGNGQITVCDKASGDTIYRHSFSTLFQEWLSTEEATKLPKSFENSFQIPYPLHPIRVTVELYDIHRRVCAALTHEINPKDALINHRGGKRHTPYKTLLKSGTQSDCIDVAIVAEGYTPEEMETFYKDAETAMESILAHEPFKSNRDKFNFIAVASPSKDSGVSIPYKDDWKETAVSSHFHTFYSQRYLTTLHIKDLNNLLAGIPYEHIIILANTDEYGGGGIYNSYTLTTAHHPLFKPVVVHEFGHSFGGLADEYFYDDQYEEVYPKDIEPWEPNITTLVHFENKWKDMLPKATPIPTPYTDKKEDVYTKVGVYEGAGYVSKGVYRSTPECRMKINEAPVFCPVCQNALTKLIQFYTEQSQPVKEIKIEARK